MQARYLLRQTHYAADIFSSSIAVQTCVTDNTVKQMRSSHHRTHVYSSLCCTTDMYCSDEIVPQTCVHVFGKTIQQGEEKQNEEKKSAHVL